MLDASFIQRKIKLIQEDLGELEGLSHFSFDEIAKDYVKLSAVERILEKIIMRAIDVNQHLVSELCRGDEKIKGYEDTFYVLADLGVYDKDFAGQIAPSVGLRNRLVHEYNDTDSKIIYESVGDAIKEYTKYCSYILKFIEKMSQ